MPNAVVAVMARSPIVAPDTIKTRLAPAVPDPLARAALYRAFLSRLVATALPVARVAIAYTPEGGPAGFDDLGVSADDVFAQDGDDLGTRERRIFERFFALGVESVVVVGSDVPTLPARHFSLAFDALAGSPAPVVIGPVEDGGYCLLGLSSRACGAGVPDLFSDVRWSTPHACDDTLLLAARAGLPVVALPTWYDVDTPDDLARFTRDTARDAGTRAPDTRSGR